MLYDLIKPIIFDPPIPINALDLDIQRFIWNDFVLKLANNPLYLTERAAKQGEAEHQNFTGKCGEHLACLWLKKNNLIDSDIEVDYTIYGPNEKNWDADLLNKSLKGSAKKFHVKTCSIYRYSDWYGRNFKNKYFESYVFQNSNTSGSGGTDELFKSGCETDLIISMIVLSDRVSNKNTGYLRSIIPWPEVSSILKDPIREDLKDIKKCLYVADILELKSKMEQLSNAV